MASNRFFPSRVQTVLRETKLLPFSFAPNGAGAPAIVSGAGVSSVTRTSAGVFTVTLQDQYKSIQDAQASLQFAATPSVTQASLTVGATNSFTVTAGSNYVGAAGNNLNVIVVAGAGSLTVTTDGTNITVTLATGGSLPSAIEAAFNSAINSGMASITAVTGSAAITAAQSSTPLAGGGSTSNNIVQFGPIDVVVAKTVVISVLNAATGTTVDIPAAIGNQINVELCVRAE